MSSDQRGSEDHEEILRLRQRAHAAEASLRALVWRLKSVETRTRELHNSIGRIRREVDEMRHAEEIAAAVAEKMRQEAAHRNALFTTWPRKIAAVVVGALVVADSLRGLIGL